MALDPQAQDVINLVIKSGRPAYNTLSPKDARQLFRETRPGATSTGGGSTSLQMSCASLQRQACRASGS